MTDLISVTVNDGKYTIQQVEPGKLEALRYGEEWPAFRDSSPDNLHIALAYEIAALRTQIRYWKRGTDLINECLKTAARADHGDAPFPLDHAEAKFWHNAQMEAYRHALEMMGLPQDFGPVEKEARA
jgi:hypothetical protein